jgi:hypothetical protein
MSDEITLQSLGLKKTLDKMTAKELRQLVMDKIPQITGATGMDKDQLIAAIKEEEGVKTNPYKAQIHDIKSEIRSMREQKAKATARKDKDILRKRINKLKKRTRRLSRAV